ncbi:MAG: winged helix-turn-helix domain-containing protein [Methanococcaceae archaeon]
MLDALITSRTRLKLLLRLFLNSSNSAYLKELAKEFGESSNAVRLELNRFEKAGLLKSEVCGNKKLFRANVKHPLFNDIRSIISKTIGIDQIVEELIAKLGEVKQAYITGDFATGKDGKTVDIVLVGTDINKDYLLLLIDKTESIINRKIRYLIITPAEINDYIRDEKNAMLIWAK